MFNPNELEIIQNAKKKLERIQSLANAIEYEAKSLKRIAEQDEITKYTIKNLHQYNKAIRAKTKMIQNILKGKPSREGDII